jgi:regulator of cell morphogenesis and NO signaling
MLLESTMLDPGKTVRELALEIPNATRIFEKMKIDYCCGGSESLAEACATAGVEVADLERLFEQAAESGAPLNGVPDFQRLTLTDLMGHILAKHHVYTKEEMVRLQSLIEKVVAAHGENHPELKNLGDVFQQMCADLTPHMFKEENVLFPYIEALETSILQNNPAPVAPFGTVNNPIRMMMMEHDTVGELLLELRGLSADYTVPADGCISYQTLYQALEAFEQDLHQHIHLENNILFPKAVEMEDKFKSCDLTRQTPNCLDKVARETNFQTASDIPWRR